MGWPLNTRSHHGFKQCINERVRPSFHREGRPNSLKADQLFTYDDMLFLQGRSLRWRYLMQCSFGTCPSSNDETVCLVDSVESHVPEEDDVCNVDIRIMRASNASEPSFQVMERADWGFNYPTKSWPSRTIAFTLLVIWSITL